MTVYFQSSTWRRAVNRKKPWKNSTTLYSCYRDTWRRGNKTRLIYLLFVYFLQKNTKIHVSEIRVSSSESMIEWISHITFIVHDIEKSSLFLKDIFDAEEIYDSREKNFSLSREKFFMIGNVWIVIMEWGSLPEKSYNHIAFQVSPEEFPRYVEKVKNAWVEIRESRNRINGEWASIYFYDYDNHLFEIHSGTLETRLKAYAKNPQ